MTQPNKFNEMRVTRGIRALEAYLDGQRPDEASAADCICDLLHFAESIGLDPARQLERAFMNYRAESIKIDDIEATLRKETI